MSKEPTINWDEVVKKEARGKNDEDLGEVQEVGDTYVLVQKGLINKDKFYIPKYQAEGYDGNALWFKVSEEVRSERVNVSGSSSTVAEE
ncbi:MAG TPA: hypothetical protein VFR94_16065 [Nitrososphaeraceae archaeon]|nr:hypothetical protein [Nitrososphaeraceae archaeon]